VAKKRIIVKLDIADPPSTGGKARAARLSAEDLGAADAKAVRARWDKYYREHPEKLEAKLAKRKKAPR
jgi:hypothetical protein